MPVRTIIKPSSYYDSLALMRINSELLKLPGVDTASIMMGTEQNKHSIGNKELLTPEVMSAGPNDLFVVVMGESDDAVSRAIETAIEILESKNREIDGKTTRPVRTLISAIEKNPLSQLAIISIPGEYVRQEAMKALELNLNLLIFSDNVSLEDEIAIKQKAIEKDLLVMGPDCGTAIIGGASLAFANAVRRGRIGIVAAAGTGLQEVACIIDHLGQGISHAIGTGGRDVGEQVGGVSMIQGLKMLDSDDSTEVILIVSKPPSPTTMKKVLEKVEGLSKPVVVNFLDGDNEILESAGLAFANNLQDGAILSVSKLLNKSVQDIRKSFLISDDDLDNLVPEAKKGLANSQKYIRGLFSGGTFCSESTVLIRDSLKSVSTNVKIKDTELLPDPHKSIGHSCVDLGEDIFTVGHPHPMLEQTQRIQRFNEEVDDPETAVVLLDIVLGYGVHDDPAGEFAEAISDARKRINETGRKLIVVASVCGVDADPQNRTLQVEKLKKAGVLVMPTNYQATELAIRIVSNS